MTAHSTDLNAAQLQRLSEEVTRIAAALADLSIGNLAPAPAFETGTGTELQEQTEIPLEAVRWLIRARRERARYFPGELFAEPAWDILLDLLEAELSHGRVTVSSLCIAAAVPAATGLRWINHLVKRGLLGRRRDPNDARRVYVELEPEVSQALRQYFTDLVLPGRA